MGDVLRPFLLFMSVLAAAAAGAGVRPMGFVFTGVSNRFITPNGDGRNDDVAFRFSNPRDAAGMVTIYDVRGHSLATIPVNPGDTSEVWNGRADGRAVPSGIYIYVVDVDNVVVSGALVVVR